MKPILRAGRVLVVLSLLAGSGAHWALVQGAAWARMAYLRAFDPCALCLIVEDGASRSGPALAATEAGRPALFFEARRSPARPAPARFAPPALAAVPLPANAPALLRPPTAGA